MLQDYKLGVRMLLKYPGLTIAGGLALAEGDRIVLIETQNTLTNRPELRIARDFLEWRRELKTIEDLGAYRTVARTLATSKTAPEPIQVAELTAAAFRTARVPPLLGRGLLASDETPGAPGVIVLGYNVWQRSFGGRQDVVGLVVNIGNTPATVIGVMPDGFRFLDADTDVILPQRFERGVVQAASLIRHFIDERAEVRLVLGDDVGPFGSGTDQLYRCLRRLALVIASETQGPGLENVSWSAVEHDYAILLTAAAPGSIPANIWRTSHVIYL